MEKQKGLSVVIPAYGDVKTVMRSVYSAASAYRGRESKYELEILIFADDIEYQREHGGVSQYDFFTADAFKSLVPETDIKVIHNLEEYDGHIYQGGARLEGFWKAKYQFVCLMDCDDVFAPSFIVQNLDVINREQERCPIYRVGAGHLSFDENGYQKNVGYSIWVQAYCWNTEFVKRFGFTREAIYDTEISQRQGEDYRMCRFFDYAFQHNRATEEDVSAGRCRTKDGKPLLWQELFIDSNNPDALPNSFWYPNVNSLSRQDSYYGQHLAGSTMASSNAIARYMEQYNEEHGLEREEDEAFKHTLLNMTIYAWFNLADFLKTVSVSRYSDKPYEPLEQDWLLLRDSVSNLRTLLCKYFEEIQYADIEDELYRVRHMSDAHICNVWFGSFYDFMNGKNNDLLIMSYDAMIRYCQGLNWDQNAINCTESPQFRAFVNRLGGTIDQPFIEGLEIEH